MRLDGVELREWQLKDGGFTYVHHATNTMQEYYTYELVDISGFGWGEKIPRRMSARSCKMGTDYGPEHIRSMFREKPPEIEKPNVTIDVRGIIADARGEESVDIELDTMTPEEKDRVERTWARMWKGNCSSGSRTGAVTSRSTEASRSRP